MKDSKIPSRGVKKIDQTVADKTTVIKAAKKTGKKGQKKILKGMAIASGALGVGSVVLNTALSGLRGDIVGAVSSASGIIEPIQRLYSAIKPKRPKSEAPAESAFKKMLIRQVEKFDNTAIGHKMIGLYDKAQDTARAIANNAGVKKVVEVVSNVTGNALVKKTFKVGTAAFLIATAASNPVTLAVAVVSITAVAVMTTKQCLDVRKGVHLETKRNLLLERKHNDEIQNAMVKKLGKPGLENLQAKAKEFLNPRNQENKLSDLIAKIKVNKLSEWGKAFGVGVIEGSAAILGSIGNPGLAAAAAVSVVGGVGQEAKENINRRIVHRNLTQEIRDLNHGEDLTISHKALAKISKQEEIRTKAFSKLMDDLELPRILNLPLEKQNARINEKLESLQALERAEITKPTKFESVKSACKSGWQYFKCSQLSEFVKSPYAKPEKFQAKINQDKQNYNKKSQTEQKEKLAKMEVNTKKLSNYQTKNTTISNKDLNEARSLNIKELLSATRETYTSVFIGGHRTSSKTPAR